MELDSFYLIMLGFVFGGLVVYGLMKWDKARKDEFDKRINDLQDQINGKQLPYFVRDGLEDIKALENKDSFDLARLKLFLEEAMKTVDEAASRQKRMSEVYDDLRSHKRRKGDQHK